MQELNINSGLETFNLNGVIEVTINPTDITFIEKLYCAFEDSDKLAEVYEAKIEKADGRDKFVLASELDCNIREHVNAIFEQDICTALFGNTHVCALSDGIPLWANLLFKFMDIVNDNTSEELKKTSSRITQYAKKYTSKYHK